MAVFLCLPGWSFIPATPEQGRRGQLLDLSNFLSMSPALR